MQNTAVYAPITSEEIVMVMISNSNWTEWSTIRTGNRIGGEKIKD